MAPILPSFSRIGLMYAATFAVSDGKNATLQVAQGVETFDQANSI